MRTWREAHRVVAELEQLHEGSRALLGALDGGTRTGNRRRRRGLLRARRTR